MTRRCPWCACALLAGHPCPPVALCSICKLGLPEDTRPPAPIVDRDPGDEDDDHAYRWQGR